MDEGPAELPVGGAGEVAVLREVRERLFELLGEGGGGVAVVVEMHLHLAEVAHERNLQLLDSIKLLKIELQQKALMLDALQSSSRVSEHEDAADLFLNDSLDPANRKDNKSTQTQKTYFVSKQQQTVESIARLIKPVLRIDSIKPIHLAGKNKPLTRDSGAQTDTQTPAELSSVFQLLDLDSTLPLKTTAKSLENKSVASDHFYRALYNVRDISSHVERVGAASHEWYNTPQAAIRNHS